MTPFDLLTESVTSLSKNKVRTALSMLGIVIGVAAVITLVAMAEATKLRVDEEIAKLGDDWMFIRYWGFPRGGVRVSEQERKPMQTYNEARAIAGQCPAVRAATPQNRMNFQVRSSYGNVSTQVIGALPCYQDIRRYTVDSGRLLEDEDEIHNRPVCVIGRTPARDLFGSVNPVGEYITIKKARFKVVGLFSSKGRSDNRDLDDIVLVPYMVFQRKIAGGERSASLIAAARHGIPAAVAEQQISRLLREIHNLRPGDPDDFQIFAQSESAQVKEESGRIFAWLLGMIAGISLVVGGIGIMNIMLVAVTERTREIGVRMALGARGADILSQFLIEAVLLCGIGGLLGLGAGAGFNYLVEYYKGLETVFSWWIAFVAMGFACATGVFFGFYPAWRASRLDPIEALRYE